MPIKPGQKIHRIDYRNLSEEEQRQAGIAKIMKLSQLMPNGCREWQGFVHKFGYGMTSYKGQGWRPHRLLWTLVHGAVPRNIDVCHTCDNRKCVNLNHLWLGTRRENLIDCRRKNRHHRGKMTHCHRGHEFTPDNTGFKHWNGYTMRVCKFCERIKNRLKAGWPLEEALKFPKLPLGRRSVPAWKAKAKWEAA